MSPEAQVSLGVVAVFVVVALLAWVLRPRPWRRRRSRRPQVDAHTAKAPLAEHDMLIGSFLADAKRDFYDIQNCHAAFGAVMLQEETGISFVADDFPHYFTGCFDARLVLVHPTPPVDWAERNAYRDFGDYISQHVSRREPAAAASRVISFTQPFCHAQNEHAPATPDSILELYFIPYAARSLGSRKLNGRLFRHEYDRLMEVVTAYPRDYVIFCGVAFERLLAPHIVARVDHQFRLPTRAGVSKSQYRFSVVQLLHRDKIVRAAMAQSFAMRTTPISAYGRSCHERYVSGRDTTQQRLA